ncbi:MAG: NmrA family transcriptional regulator [Chromatiales bacterium]|jgi:uncharacterized protein YbjT (DUF2867 family)|nr:NmrA family transcriptional regulator [Chromatiales bacterium]MDP7093684.1 NmrA/HSCARG family protein [Gammaproteobacteria bacterium]MDP7270594.1 NmrA/HSCARG family protein [Gammaproteobacteria bacterium]HJP04303.1 NmrA/HSCARG family protein [Gammaproteobacteria bacterium]
MLHRFFLCLLIALFMVACSTTDTTEPETVLVGGATGRQGNAVVDELLSRGYRVRGLTRKPGGRKALALAAKGVEVMQGDYADSFSLRVAMAGVDKVFFYSGFSRNEVAEGKNVIAAAKEAGIDHLVYSSGAAAEPGHGLVGAAKMLVEIAIVESGVPYTVFRPVAFMENFRGQQARTAKNGISDSRSPERLLHFISIPDIGFLVAEAFDYPAEWKGVAVNIASDVMTVREYVDTYSKVMGREVPYNRQPLEEYLAGMPKPLQPLFRWYDQAGYEADVEGLRRRYPNLITFEQYLRDTGWENWQPE